MRLALKPGWLLLCALLVACASTPSSRQEVSDASRESLLVSEESLDCEREREEQCFTQACGSQVCVLFPSEEVEPGSVVLARGVGPASPPSAALRYWAGILIRSPQGKPVFIIPWKKPFSPNQQQMLAEARRLAKKPLEKHHVFPREPGLKAWFEIQGINVHEHTLLVDLETHRRIHAGPAGGPWNQAWRDFQRLKPGATKQQMYEYALELIKRFKLAGYVVPYYSKAPYLLDPATAP